MLTVKIIMFVDIDIMLSHFSFAKPVKSSQTCISMSSFCYQRVFEIMEQADDISKLLALN